MNGLSPEARSIIKAARGGDEPTSDDRKRIRTSLVVRLGAGAAAAGATTSAGSGAAAAGAMKATGAGLAGMFPKGIALVSAVSAIGLGAYVMRAPSSGEGPAPIQAAASVSSQPVVAPSSEPEPKQPEPRATAEGSASPPARAWISPEVPSEDTSPHLADEVEALREAHTALREGRAGEAMEVLDQDAAPSSGLEQERAAMRVFALCRLGKTQEAQRQAKAFLAQWPKSPHAARVRTACTEAPSDNAGD